MSGYQRPDDLRRAADMAHHAPVEVGAFLAFDHAARRTDGRFGRPVADLP